MSPGRRSALFRALVYSSPALALLIAVLAWNPSGDFWGAVEFPKAQCEAYDARTLCETKHLSEAVYAPAKLARLIREPQNTITNLAYATAGLAILLAARRPAGRSLGCAAIFLGVGSGLYHASLVPEWRLIDILGVYAVLFALLFVGASVVVSAWQQPRFAWSGVVASWAVAIFTGAHRNDIRWWGIKPFDSTYVMIVSVALGCGMALAARTRVQDRRRYLHATVVLAVAAPLAFVGGQADRFGGFWATPEALIQGHAVWHTLGAVAILAAYEIFAATGFDRSTLSVAREVEQEPIARL